MIKYILSNIRRLKPFTKYSLKNGTTFRKSQYIGLLIILILSRSSVCQKAHEDSLIFTQQIADLIQKKMYASAHLMLEDRIEQFGVKTSFVCTMVDNALKNFSHQENYDIFYLKDEINQSESMAKNNTGNIKVARLRYPQRFLEKMIKQNQEKALPYKLLGDYYELQLSNLNNFEFVDKEKINMLEEKIFDYYSKAQQFGYDDRYLNRWLGDYHSNKGQLDIAKNYYLKNTKIEPKDPISYYRLSEISYQNKRYTQAYNYALESLKLFSKEDIYLRYDALRLGANSLKELAENKKFIKMINESIQLLPDLQEAYIDLAEFYYIQGNFSQVAKILEKMLLNNPYDLKGYRVIENYLIESKNFSFADTLFEEMILKYENWDEVLANIYWSKGNIAHSRNLPSDANNFWEISRNYMRRYLPENHKLIKQIGQISN